MGNAAKGWNGMDGVWITQARLVLPQRIAEAALGVSAGRITAIRRRAPRGARTISARGGFVAPGFIDLHVWGEPGALSRELIRHGTTAFLAALGPAPRPELEASVAARADAIATRVLRGAACLGWHLEGPFLNPARAGALPARWMRRPSVAELARLARASGGRLRMMTLAPELPGALEAIRWCARHRVVVSLGHSEADAEAAARAVDAGAAAVTHVFNGMPPFHHRAPGLVGVALTEKRLTAMGIADGAHVSPSALRLLWRAKGSEGVALVTDSVRYQRRAWRLRARAGAYYTRAGTLAGSRLTMLGAVRRMVEDVGVPLADAVRMASEVPARLLGLRDRGTLEVGRRADLVVFDQRFRVQLTLIAGRVVHQRGSQPMFAGLSYSLLTAH